MRDAIDQALRLLQLGSELDVLAAIEVLKKALAQPEPTKCVQMPYAVGGSFGGAIKIVSKGGDQSAFGHQGKNK